MLKGSNHRLGVFIVKNKKITLNKGKSFSLFCYLLTVFYCLLLSACFQPEAGCLDINATNFDLGADEDCGVDDKKGSCPCKYPIFSFDKIDYSFSKLDYLPNTSYQIKNQYFRVKSIKFYLSNFRFIRTNGESISVLDTISLTVLNEENELKTKIFENDFLLINKQNKIDLGMISQSGQFDSICFFVGIKGIANSADPTLIRNSRHPLADEAMHFGKQSEGYIFNQIIINKDTLSDIETILNIGGSENLVEVKLPFSYKSAVGKDFSLGTLRIDYSEWFDGINFAADSDTDMIKNIIEKTAKIFSVEN